MSLSFTILGTGALGGFYGSRLLVGGVRVRFVARSDLDVLREQGLRVESPLGDQWHRPVEVFSLEAPVLGSAVPSSPSPLDPLPRSDVICIAVKTTENHRLVELLRPLVYPGVVLLNLQNGLTAEEELAAAFPEAHVLGGLCFLCSNKLGPGHVRHLDYGAIGMAALDPADRSLLDPIVQAFAAGGIEVDPLPSLPAARWRKLAWNIPFNGLSVVFNANTDRMISDAVARALARSLMEEVALGAEACGVPFERGFLDELMEKTARMRPYAPSMRLDFQGGRPLEVEYIYRRPLREAARRGLSLPRIEVLAAQLEFLDSAGG